MTRFRLFCLAGLLIIAAALVPGPSPISAQVANRPVGLSVGLSHFDTTITGRTSDKHHVVSVEVQTDDAAHTVILAITIHDKLQKGMTGFYQFALPAGDLVFSGNLQAHSRTAVLDTHQHLGAYGHITATWTYGIKGAKVQTFDASLCSSPSSSGPATTTSTQYSATGAATLALTFPCDGILQAQLTETGLIIDSDQRTDPSDRSAAFLGSGIYFSAALAGTQDGSNKEVQVLAGEITPTGGVSTFVAGVDVDTHALIGLTHSEHSVVDVLPPSGVSQTSTGATRIVYSGALGTASIVLTATGTLENSMRPGGCANPLADQAQQATTVAQKTTDARVSGEMDVAVCGAPSHTLYTGSSQGVIESTSAVGSITAPTVIATPPTGTTPPTSGAGGGTGATVSVGGLAITSLSPAGGATGVSTLPVIRATFSGSLAGGNATVILSEASNPSAIVMLPAPTIDIAHDSLSTTPAAALKAQTQYILIVTAMNGSGGLASSQSSFTTGT